MTTTDDAAALLARGNDCLQSGDTAAALDLLGRAAAADPGSAPAQAALAVALQAAGRPAEARDAFAAALARDPTLAEAQYGLAVTLQATGATEAAVDRFDALLAARPDLAEAHYGRAVALRSLHRHAEAEAGFAAALALDDSFAEAAVGRALALIALGRADAAITAGEQALLIDPDYTDARATLAAALQAAHRLGEAATQWQEVLLAQPENVPAMVALGNTLLQIGLADQAAASFRAALQRAPDLAEALHGLGNALLELGEAAAGIAALERAIAVAPRRLASALALVNARRMTRDEPIAQMLLQRAAEGAPLGTEERAVLCFALAKLHDDIGEPARGFDYLLEANALHRSRIAYHERATLTGIAAHAEAFTAALMQRLGGLGDPDARPAFIVGMPRSGSTLIEQMLASHPAVFGAGERGDFVSALHAMATIEEDAPAIDRFVAGLDAERLRDLGRSYLHRLRSALPPGAAPQRITDKLLANFQFVGMIHLALPNARIIHTRRDPVDTCLSNFAKLYGSSLAFPYDLGELGRYWRAYDTLMAHWRQVLPPGVMLEIDYEASVADFPAQARRVLAHLGLDWDDAVLAFHTTVRPVRTASQTQVRQPIYRGSVGRWRPEAAKLRPLLDALELEA